MSRPDTWKQSRVTALLAARGIDGGWRAYVLACRRQGMSAARIARRLAQETDVELDDSTLSLWIKQAQREADNKEGLSQPLPEPSGQKREAATRR